SFHAKGGRVNRMDKSPKRDLHDRAVVSLSKTSPVDSNCPQVTVRENRASPHLVRHCRTNLNYEFDSQFPVEAVRLEGSGTPMCATDPTTLLRRFAGGPCIVLTNGEYSP